MSARSLGPYELGEPLGRGGMGTVYQGRNRETNHQVAVKVLSPNFAADHGFRERFEAEIRSLEQLRHPNIVQLYGYGEQDGSLYFAMELVEGPSLQQELSESRVFTWREVVGFAIEICAALKHAHDHGIVHRDLKPANLLLTKDEKIKLTDFGIAKLFGNTQLTVSGGILGTADYMAPEQAEGIGATAKSDLYSLGSVMYCLLSGHPPFRGKSMAEVIHKVRYNDPIPIRRVADETPEELEQVIAQLLSKSPEDRVPTARALSNRLKAIHHALSIKEGTILKVTDPHDKTRVDISEHMSEEEFAELETVYEQPTSGSSAGVALAPMPAPRTKPAAPPLDARLPSSHYTVVDEAHQRRHLITDDLPSESAWSHIGIVACLISLLAILATMVWQLRKPPTADQLHTKIMQTVDQSPDQLIHIEDTVRAFMRRFPEDPRLEDVTEIYDEIKLDRLERQLELTARLKNASRSLAPVEQAVVEAMRQEDLNPVAAARRFNAIIDLFATDPDATLREKECIKLSRVHMKKLNTQIQRNANTAIQALQDRLATATKTIDTDPNVAKDMLLAIVLLYDEKSWADEVVSQARQLLENQF